MSLALPPHDVMLRAFADRDPSYVGVFLVGVKTTGIFCRPGCPARTPKPENVEFFATPRDALLAGFRPCKRCRPMEREARTPAWVQTLLDRIEEHPEVRWRDRDLRVLGVEPERARRYFRQRYGMTFHAYARARRLGLSLRGVRKGQDLFVTGLDHGFESSSGFRDAFARLFGDAPSRIDADKVLTVKWIDTPIGAMLAGANDDALILLEFADRRMLETQVRTLQRRLGCVFVPGETPMLAQTTCELGEYFAGARREFTVHLRLPGTEFQQQVWRALLEIPYGQTRSYQDIARKLGEPGAMRAVGKANGDNRIAIIVPCHRVIKSDGSLCGYGGGLWRKQRLLELEAGLLPLDFGSEV
ncbi:MAG TPA: trifunctional transcriptional activator/DNA repair protein Ada/methylated-DNA--[protein]-cysteine S-methyltransferase [Fimbriimonadaceae bacterium]|nr:trifunctional transcriptional activator/DNA repair protein Ada/methylated-DNA--[protein]-cysteine S-methyltransferase [Fimbriimonadaceae bacterium]